MDIWNYYDGDLKYPDIYKYKNKKDIAFAIAKFNPKNAYTFLKKYKTDKSTKQLLESIIAKHAWTSYEYAKNVLKGPFKTGEKIIATWSLTSLLYAKEILKDQFPLGEKAILKSAIHAVRYATLLGKTRWEEAESIIAKNKLASKDYTNDVLKKDFYLDGKLIYKYER